MQRPLGVTITAILMVLNVCVDVGLSLTSPGVNMPNQHPSGPSFSPVMIAVHIGLFVLILLQFLAVVYYWLGRPWARWLVLVGCIFYLTGLRYLHTQWHPPYTGAALTILSSIMAIFLLWYLHVTEVREWFAQPRIASPTNK